jgi:4-hydroxy-3-polyprenylbenzoate decarboxylase
MKDLRDYIGYLSGKRRLLTIGEEVDPDLEIAAFTDRANRESVYESKTLLFNKVRGYDIPVVTNLFGSMSTVRELFSDTYANELLGDLGSLKSKGKISLVKGSRMFLNSKPKLVASRLDKYAKMEGLDELPITKSWPKDGGKFITWPLVITESPKDGSTNVGVYRMQVYDSVSTGMHWQAQKGGAIHAKEAEEEGMELNVSVCIGTDPHNMISAVAPLPVGFSEFAFSGIVRGSSTVLMKNGKYPPVPANSEIVINGRVDPKEKRKEGPYGDHTGYYSFVEPYHVFHVDAIYAKKDPIFPASLVGQPWHEDAVLGLFLSDFLKPVIKATNESIVDIYMPPEGIFTNMCFVSIKKRFPGEAKKAMFSILGLGQLSFTKIIVVFDDDIDIRDLRKVLWALSTRVEPQRDVQIITNATSDSLDPTANLPAFGSKMLIDATKKTREEGYNREWPETISMPKELEEEVERKWRRLKS